MVGIDADHPDRYASLVRGNHLGAVFLVRPAGVSPALLRARLAALQRADSSGVPLHVSVDQEGGAVQTLRSPGFARIPSATVQGSWTAATLRSRSRLWGRQLSSVGITLDLAPVADTVPAGTAQHNPPIGRHDRQYGATPAAVATAVATVVTALQKQGVTATAKHFPGLGRVRVNTDTSAAAVDPRTTRKDPALDPFAAAIRAGAGAVMISSARYPALDPSSIATFSARIVTGLLRRQMGFTGVIVSDDLGGAVAVQSVPVGDRAVRFVAAGGDLALSVRTHDAGVMTRALSRQAGRSPRFARQLAAAAKRVLADKERAGLLNCR